MTPELVTNGLLVLLLVTVIVVVLRLERRLNAMKAGQAHMTASAIELTSAVTRAEAAIKGLRMTADGCGAELDERIKRARGIADELGMLTDRGNRSFERAEPMRPRFIEPVATPVLRSLSGAR